MFKISFGSFYYSKHICFQNAKTNSIGLKFTSLEWFITSCFMVSLNTHFNVSFPCIPLLQRLENKYFQACNTILDNEMQAEVPGENSPSL